MVAPGPSRFRTTWVTVIAGAAAVIAALLALTPLASLIAISFAETGELWAHLARYVIPVALAQTALSRRAKKQTRGPAEPFALLIAPTRELAAQVARELGWLYAKLDTGVCVVAGGASFRDELRALSAHPLVVVG